MRSLLLSVLVALWPATALAQTARQLEPLLAELPRDTLLRSALGVTRKQSPIHFVASPDDFDPATPRIRLLLIGGLDGSEESVKATLACLKWFHGSDAAKPFRERYTLACVPCVNVDGWSAGKAPANLSGGNPLLGYPPKGDAYADPANPEAVYLWRWLGTFAPDLVLIVRPSTAKPEKSELAVALARHAPAGVGVIPSVEIVPNPRTPEKTLAELLQSFAKNPPARSPARLEILKRVERTPLEVAKQLANRYGQELNSVEYIAALALVGRLRLGQMTKDATHRAAVERLVAPYLSGARSPGTEKASPAQLAGHLVFGELAVLKKDKQYLELLRRAADRCLGGRGVPGHSDMSDAVFMGCPLLARAGALTGEAKYFTACADNLALMRKLCLRRDGLYRHSPLDETAWGRGNGFPALGLALSLSDIPVDNPAREPVLKAFREHMAALLKHQDFDGTWHQVIDFPGSYRELSCTCMLAVALARGIRQGWLERQTYEPAVAKAWKALKTRIAPDGSLIDVCTGTGKQKSLREYFDRKAILGVDPRGGAMALLAAVELAEGR